MLSADELRERRLKLQQERLAKKQNNVVQLPVAPVPDDVEDLLAEAVPDASLTEDEKEDVAQHILSADQRIAQEVESIPILRAYEMWCGKMTPAPVRGNSEVFISCPLPGHADSNPSATANTDSDLWMCFRCEQGGDALDLAAIKYDMPNYKQGQEFHNLYRKIAEQDLGWSFENQGGFQVGVSPEDKRKKLEAAEQRIKDAQLAQPKGEQPPHNVIDIETGEEPYEDEHIEDFSDMPSLDWKPLVKEGTFLDHYMSECTNDTSPEEYHFWNGLLALSLAAGRNVQLNRLKANLFVCHLGKSGIGKGMSMYPLTEVLKAVMPFDEMNPSTDGVFMINGIQTGEGLVKDFMGEVPSSGRVPVIRGNIKGLIRWDEMATVVINSKRGNGNIIKPKLNEFYDCNDEISTRAASGSRKAVNPYACVITSLQPDNLRDGLSKEDVTSGFLNRFVFVTGTRKPQRAIDEYEYNFTTVAQSLTHIQLSYKSWDNVEMEFVPTKLAFSEEAAEKWTEFHDRVVDPVVANGSGSVSRVNALMKKLIMLFAINALETVISLDSVNRAMQMWDYIFKSYTAVDSRVSKSAMSETMEDILSLSLKLQSQSKTGIKYITASSIMKQRSKYELRDISNSLDELVRAGLMDRHETKEVNKLKGRGRPLQGQYCYLPIPEVV